LRRTIAAVSVRPRFIDAFHRDTAGPDVDRSVGVRHLAFCKARHFTVIVAAVSVLRVPIFLPLH
jgi:hypothetical protein